MKKTIILVLIILNYISINAQNEIHNSIYEKDTITIVITDSGLGGISVVADLERKMRSSGHFAKINLIFANALFKEEGGYNSLSKRSEKIEIFNKALTGMAAKYKPDLMLIACNTLSVIYKETNFAKTTQIPVIGIVDIGVREIQNAFSENQNSKVLIFGTETTVKEDNYRINLVKKGISNNLIVSQACPQLQQYIENNPKGEDTEMLIITYVDEALEKAKITNENIFISLNCTHFPYSKELWLSACSFSGFENVTIVNPNIQMAEILLNNQQNKKHKKTNIQIKVISKVKIKENNINAIAEIIKKQSEDTSKALLKYEIVKDLF